MEIRGAAAFPLVTSTFDVYWPKNLRDGAIVTPRTWAAGRLA